MADTISVADFESAATEGGVTVKANYPNGKDNGHDGTYTVRVNGVASDTVAVHKITNGKRSLFVIHEGKGAKRKAQDVGYRTMRDCRVALAALLGQ